MLIENSYESGLLLFWNNYMILHWDSIYDKNLTGNLAQWLVGLELVTFWFCTECIKIIEKCFSELHSRIDFYGPGSS